MLAPVYELLFYDSFDALCLTEDQVTISYKTYKADNQADMQEITDQQLAPGKFCKKIKFSIFHYRKAHETLFLVASVAQGHPGQQAVSHAMVLDTYDQAQDLLIFKNTYDDESSGQPKKFKIKRTDPNAPEELYFVHIDIRDLDNLPSQEQRKANKEAEMKKKKLFYQSSGELKMYILDKIFDLDEAKGEPSQEQREANYEAEKAKKQQQYSTQQKESNQSTEQPEDELLLEESAEPNRTSFCSLCCCLSHNKIGYES